MYWLAIIRKILGYFWYSVFNDQDFILAVEKVNRQIAALALGFYRFIRDRKYRKTVRPGLNVVPVAIYIQASSKRKPYVDAMTLTNLSTGDQIGSTVDNKGYIYTLKDVHALPLFITEAAANNKHTFVKTLDYTLTEDLLWIHYDLDSFGFPTVTLLVDDAPYSFYKVFGWYKAESPSMNAVKAFYKADFGDNSLEVWDIHINGATVLNSKQLLAAVNNSCVSKVDGDVIDIWTEGNCKCVNVAHTAHSALSSVVNVTVGQSVKKGHVLIGNLKSYTGDDIISQQLLPAIRVRTDVGELLAKNTLMSAVTSGSNTILPLTQTATGSETPAVYIADINSKLADQMCPYIDILPSGSSTVNPCSFVLRQLRKNRGCYMQLQAEKLQDILAYLNVIRLNCCQGGIITVFIKAQADTASIAVHGFSALSGNAAVALTITVTVYNNTAEAKEFK